jgi:hypothetical protein
MGYEIFQIFSASIIKDAAAYRRTVSAASALSSKGIEPILFA